MQNRSDVMIVHAFREHRCMFCKVGTVAAVEDKVVEGDLRATLSGVCFVRSDADPVDCASDPVRFRFQTNPTNADYRAVVTITYSTHAIVYAEAAIWARIVDVRSLVDENVHVDLTS